MESMRSYSSGSGALENSRWSPESSRLRGPNQIPASSTPKARWSMDDNLAHCSYEAGILEQPELTSPENMWTRTVGKDLTGAHHDVSIHFEKGIPVKVEIGDKVVTGSLEIFKALNEIGRVHGVGRIDIVESRFIGLKSCGWLVLSSLLFSICLQKPQALIQIPSLAEPTLATDSQRGSVTSAHRHSTSDSLRV
ncbi:hypothetical protein H634G_09603 [Metarhizium anisopliae BRIP 53293]|uniref:argininosuccinate synthase n=1 Tax=Metarhizium anisopliae BRIP 53293 TaxID=1291518 RepID=A0A0D9NMX9_METAN|nr:hypothetical protein H634G_09603 [Metarhizium anisopliae BRIP 53293]